MLNLHREKKLKPGRDGNILNDHRQEDNVEAHRLCSMFNFIFLPEEPFIVSGYKRSLGIDGRLSDFFVFQYLCFPSPSQAPSSYSIPQVLIMVILRLITSSRFTL